MPTSIYPIANHPVAASERQAGFTILELILSMFLTSLLLVILSAGTYSVVNDWQRESSSLEVLLDDSLAISQIEKALFSAFPHSYFDSQRFERFVYFEGYTDELSWVSTVSPQRQPGLTAWKLSSDNIDGISLSLAPAFSDTPKDRLDEVSASALLKNYSAEFHYLEQKNTEEKEWLDEWLGDERQSLPIAVHIIFRVLDERGRASREDSENLFEITIPIKSSQHEDLQAVTQNVN